MSNGITDGSHPRTLWDAARPVALTVLILGLLVADQIAKHFARTLLTAHMSVQVIPGILGLTLVENYGAAFSILGGARWFLVGLAAITVGLCIVALRRRWLPGAVADVCWALVLAGAVGNAIDRVAFGYVTDYLQTLFVSFPVFNIADIVLTVGVTLLLVIYVRRQRSHE